MVNVNELIELANSYKSELQPREQNSPSLLSHITHLQTLMENLKNLQKASQSITSILQSYQEISSKPWADQTDFQKIHFMQPRLIEIQKKIEQGELQSAKTLVENLNSEYHNQFGENKYHQQSNAYQAIQRFKQSIDSLEDIDLQRIQQIIHSIHDDALNTQDSDDLVKNPSQIPHQLEREQQTTKALRLDESVDTGFSEIPKPLPIASQALTPMPRWQMISLPGQQVTFINPINISDMRKVLNFIQTTLVNVDGCPYKLRVNIPKECLPILLKTGSALYHSLDVELSQLEQETSSTAALVPVRLKSKIQQDYYQLTELLKFIASFNKPDNSPPQLQTLYIPYINPI